MSSSGWCAVRLAFCKHWVRVPFSSAVQSERKPIEVMPREKHINCAASTQKIYIRKDLNSPLIATPTFISDSETDASRWVSVRADGSNWCSLHHPAVSVDAILRGLFCADPVCWSRGCWLISSSRLFTVMELCSWPLTPRYSCNALRLLSDVGDSHSFYVLCVAVLQNVDSTQTPLVYCIISPDFGNWK